MAGKVRVDLEGITMAAIWTLLIVIASFVVLLAWASNFYLFAHYILHPKRRSRFSRLSGVWCGGWLLWLVGFILAQSAHDSRSWAMANLGQFCIIAGAACMIYTARRHWQEGAAEKRTARDAEQALAIEGQVWPPPPVQP